MSKLILSYIIALIDALKFVLHNWSLAPALDFILNKKMFDLSTLTLACYIDKKIVNCKLLSIIRLENITVVFLIVNVE